MNDEYNTCAQLARKMAAEYAAASTAVGDYQFGKAVAANSVANAILRLKSELKPSKNGSL